MSNSLKLGTMDAPWDNLVPLSMIPDRATFSTIFLIPIQTEHGRSLLLHNTDPINWNTWFPPYANLEWPLTEMTGTFRQLIDRTISLSPEGLRLDPRTIRDSFTIKICQLLRIGALVCAEELFIPREYWLKFSKSKNQWTLYAFDYWVVIDADIDVRVLPSKYNDLCLIPIEEPNLEEIRKTGKFLGKPIADNLLSILQNDSERERLLSLAW